MIGVVDLSDSLNWLYKIEMFIITFVRRALIGLNISPMHSHWLILYFPSHTTQAISQKELYWKY